MANFQKNVRCQVYKVKIRPDISTFFGHGTQKNVKCRLQAYLVTALGEFWKPPNTSTVKIVEQGHQ